MFESLFAAASGKSKKRTALAIATSIRGHMGKKPLTRREEKILIDKLLLAIGAAPVPKKRGKLRRKKTKDKA